MMLMIIKIVSGDSKLQKGRTGASRGQHKAVRGGRRSPGWATIDPL